MNYYDALPEETVLTVDDVDLCVYIVENGRWFFSNEQIAKNYGRSVTTISRHLQQHKDELIEGVHWFDKKGNLPRSFPHMKLWTKEGFIKLGNYVKSTQAERVLKALGVISRQETRLESRISDIIRDALQDFTTVVFQHPIKEYKVDIYFPDLNIVLEIDEMKHESYDNWNENYREAIIKEKLGCEFIRFNPNSNKENVGIVINNIFKRITLRNDS